VRLRRYPKYRDSGCQWLGELPAHWNVLPNRALFVEVNDRGHDDEQMLSVTIAQGVIRQDALLKDSSKKDSSNEDKAAYKLVLPGDLAYNKMRAWQGAIGVSSDRGIISPAYIVERLRRDDDPRYFHFLFRTPYFHKEAERWSYGITSDQWSLRPDHFKMIYSAVPPAHEQELIVRYVASADSRMRTLIQLRRQMIGLLKEYENVLLNRAITRGLNDGVELVDSGIEWLGPVPNGWDIVPFKQRVAFQEGPGIMAEDFRETGVPLLRISCMNSDEATLDGCNYLDPAMVERKWNHFKVRNGDYLLSASGSIGAVARATAVVAGAIPYTGIIRLWPRDEALIRMEYLRLFMRSTLFIAQMSFMKAGVGIEHFGPTHLRRMILALPPVQEQERIISALGHVHEVVAARVQSLDHEISLLREHQVRLAADIVTGRLDVRSAAKDLPEPDLWALVEPGDLVDDTEDSLASGPPEAVLQETSP
jgi:type I restriction enzyme S subunit